jgi:hypothetical protein
MKAATTVTASSTATIQSALLEKFQPLMTPSFRVKPGESKRLYLHPVGNRGGTASPEVGAISA